MTPSETLSVELSAQKTYALGAPVDVVTLVYNPGTAPQTFCTYHTPFEGIRNDIFVVQRGPGTLDYQGKLAKRAPPGPEDHRTIAPGQSSRRVTVDLREGYELVPGTYRVRFAGSGISGLPDSNWVEFAIVR